MNRKEPMKDTKMDLNPDPMCIPTISTYKEWGGKDTFVEDLMEYIEFIHEDERQDPMDPTAIY